VTPKDVMDKVNKLRTDILEHFNRFDRALKLLTEISFSEDGNVIMPNEFHELMESIRGEIFLEDKREEKSVRSHLGRMIEHLLKLKFCTSKYYHRNWESTVKRHQKEVIEYLEWVLEKPDRTLVNYTKENLSLAYELGGNYYKRDADEHADLIPGLALIPDKCPWELEDLLDKNLSEILEML
jgi:hypothetical protein